MCIGDYDPAWREAQKKTCRLTHGKLWALLLSEIRLILTQAADCMEKPQDSFSGLEEIGIGSKFKEQLCRMLESTQLFRGFTGPEIESVVDYMHAYRAPVGLTLFREGGKDKYLAFVINGKVDILKETDCNTQKHIATARPGSCLGEMSIVDDYPHSATARVVEEAEVIILTKRNLLRITEESAALGIRILWGLAWQLSARLRRTSGVLAEHL